MRVYMHVATTAIGLAVIAAAWIVAGFFAHLAFGLLRYGWRLL